MKARRTFSMPAKFSITLLSLLVLALSSSAQETPKPFSVKVTGTGRPMILIPGLSCGGQVWDGAVDYFKGRYECHVVTLAGFAGEPAIEGPMLEKVRDGLIQYMRERKMERPVVI